MTAPDNGLMSEASGIARTASGHGYAETVARLRSEIERRQLTHLSFTGHSQNDEEKGINNEAAENELPPGKSRVPHEMILAPCRALAIQKRR